jgi:uncharacterized SAM-binding protein YcdF (DUF218 family)
MSLIVFTLIVAVFVKNSTLKNRLLKVSLLLIFVTGNGFISNELFLQWETPAIDPADIKQPYHVGIVLTGGMISNKQSTAQQIFTDKTADRFIQPLRLYKQGKLKKILISGGNTDLSFMREDVSDETLKVAQLLEELGVKKEDILIEHYAKNTRENALYTAKLLDSLGLSTQRLLLFSSAFHQKRATGCFQKVGLKVVPYSTAFIGKSRSYTLDNLFIPRENNLSDTYYFIHEIVGYLVYKLLGYC